MASSHVSEALKMTTDISRLLTLCLDCCKDTDDFDLCVRCHDEGKSCYCSDNRMSIMQKSVAGDVLASEKGDARRRLATVSELRCTDCQRLITQGRYYCKPPFSPLGS